MTFTIRLERLDGTPADPPSFKTTVLAWKPGDTIRSEQARHSRSSGFVTTIRWNQTPRSRSL
jgi:hypothetical protein